MSGIRSTIAFLLLVFLLVSPSIATALTETFTELEREIDSRMSDIDIDVLDEFKRKYKCHDCNDKTFDMLLHEFEAFKRNWINEMVNFVIKELDIDE